MKFKTSKLIVLIILLNTLTNSLNAQRVGEKYYIQSAIGGKYLDVAWANKKNGTPLHLWQYNGKIQQKFTVEDAGNGYFYIKSELGKYIHVNGGNKKPKAKVSIWQGKGSDNTKWKFVEAGNGYYYIESKLGTNLDVQKGKSKNGTPIWMYGANKDNAQKWKLKPLGNNGLNVNKDGKALVSISVTGVRGNIHNNDCKKLTGSFKILLFEEAACDIYLKPEVSRSNFFNQLSGPHTSTNRSIEHKIATIKSNNDADPKNIKKNGSTFYTTYAVHKNLLAKGVKLKIEGMFRGCHKSGDFSRDYNCNLVYRASNLPIKITDKDLKKGIIKKKLWFRSSDGQSHSLVFYINIYNGIN